MRISWTALKFNFLIYFFSLFFFLHHYPYAWLHHIAQLEISALSPQWQQYPEVQANAVQQPITVNLKI